MRPPPVRILRRIDPVHASTSYFLKNHLNIILPSTPESWGKEVTWKTRRRWEDNIKMDFSGSGMRSIDWIDLAQDRDRWRTVVDVVMNLRVP